MTAVADDPSRPDERDRPRPSPTALVATLSTIGIVVSLMQTLVVPLIPSLPTLLDTTATNASWVIAVTLLASAVCTRSAAGSAICSANAASCCSTCSP
ncbi:hypothetical protein AB0M34_24795 [Nocardia sp. NPDC050193]